MKSQLLQSCRGCVPSNTEAPSQPSPRGRSSTTTSSNSVGKSSRPLGRAGEGPPVELPTLGEGMGRGFRRFGEGHLLAAVFVPAKAGLFERPKAAFFTVAADGVMHRMTVGMVETTRRKTRFPTVGATIHAKAKPPSAATAFCIYFITLIDAINSGEDT